MLRPTETTVHPVDDAAEEYVQSGLPDRFVVENARIVTPDRLIESGYLVVDGERVSSIGTESIPTRAPRIDLSGHTVIPGLIDLHGDDIERHRAPRPEATVDPQRARLTCEQENVAAGITTKYHALAFENAPDDGRSPEHAARLAKLFRRADETLLDNRVLARCELGDDACVERVLGLLDEHPPDMVSAMHHVPGVGQFADPADFDRWYTGMDSITDRDVSGGGIEARFGRLIEHAATAGVSVSSHDDDSPDRVERRTRMGVDLFEFPVTMAAATRALERGASTAMGAPNLLRGGSLWDNLSAMDAVQAGVVDVLCSDYRPHALIESVFVDTGEPLTDRVARVTSAPAEVAGLEDRGRLVEGNRADFVVLDPDSRHAVSRVFVGGRETLRTQPTR